MASTLQKAEVPPEARVAASRERETRRRLAAYLDPLATEILTRLQLEPQTAAELVASLGAEAKHVRRHLARLRRTGQVERVGETSRRGRSENLYSAGLRVNVLPPEDLVGLPRQKLDEADLAVLRHMYREAAESIETGDLERRPDRVLTRFPTLLDERGFRGVVDLHRELVTEVIDEVERARARLDGGEAPVEAVAHVLFFEYPRERWPGPPSAAEPSRRRAGGDPVEGAVETFDPQRVRILSVLAVEPASAGELAARLDIPASKVRYELERFLAEGRVKVIGKRSSRGTFERVFVVDSRAQVLSAEDLVNYSGPGTEVIHRWIVRKAFGDALEAIRVEAPRSPADVVIARVPMAVDSAAFAAISARMEAVIEKLQIHRDRSIEQLEEGESLPCLAISDMLLFERASST